MRLVLALACLAAPASAQPFDICADPGTPGLPAGYRLEEKRLDLRHGRRWFCQVLPPGYSATGGTDYPLVIVLHGGGEGPQDMLATSRGILFEILDRGYVAAFPAALPVDDGTCDYSTLPCERGTWSDDINFEVINGIVDHAAGFNLDESRIFLIGFSGGAGLIFRAIAADAFETPVTAIATSAGSLDGMNVDETALGMPLRNVTLGQPLHAILLQATNDPVVTYAGGLNGDGDVLHHSFALKVDLFRALTGNLTDPGTAMAGLPAGVTGTEYGTGTHVIQAVTGQNGHSWPAWYSPVVFDFFDRF